MKNINSDFFSKGPIILSVELNSESDLNWRFLKRNDDNSNKSLSLKYLNQIITFLNTTTLVKYLVLTGKEPFEFKKLSNLLKIAQRKKIRVSIDTNTNFTFSKLPKSVFNSINQIRLILLSLSPEKHDYWVGEKGHYKKIQRFLNFLTKKKNIAKVIFFPIFNFNYREIDKVVKFSFRNKIYCNLFPYPYFAAKKSYGLDKKLFWLIVAKINKLKKKYPLTVITDSPIMGIKYKELSGQCPSLKLMMHINVNGNSKICRYANFIIGSLNNTSLNKLWLQQQRILNSQISNNRCKKCKKLGICGGGCFVNKKSFFQPDYYCLY